MIVFHSCIKAIRLGSLSVIVMLVVGLSACATRVYYENPPTTPVALKPAIAQVLTNGNPVDFIWRHAHTTEYYEFHIYDRTDSDIQRYYRSDLTPAAICAADVCSLTMQLDMPADEGHAWRVRAYNSAGFSAWSRALFEVR